MTYRAAKRSTKIGALIFLWTSLSLSMIVVHRIHLTLFLLVVGTLVSLHILSLKILTKENLSKSKMEIKNTDI